MKKILLLLVLSIMAVLGWGQTPDTVYNRSNELYYSEWYDTCAYFYSFPAYSRYSYCLFTRTSHEEDTSFHFYNFHIVPDYVSRPLKVRGLAAMVTMTWDMCGWRRFFWRSPTRLPEYLYLYQKEGDKLVKLKEVRWDTATPQIYKLPCNHDTATWGFDSCYLYRVYFDTAVSASPQEIGWSMNTYQKQLEQMVSEKREGAAEAWDELEKSVIAHVADEVRISIHGYDVEMIVFKKF